MAASRKIQKLLYRRRGSATTPEISTSMTLVSQFCQSYVARVSFAAPSFSRTAPSQAMAVSRGSSRGPVPWRPHMPHPVLAMPCRPVPSWSSSKCRNTPSTNQLDVFSFHVGRSFFRWTRTVSTVLPLPKISDRVGTLGISILMPNQQQLFVWMP